jgi:UPF0716 protein FxsA
MRLFALFVIVPIVEIALFIQVGGWLGLLPTLLIVIATAALGTWLVRRQGLAELRRVQQSFNTLSDPTRPLAHGAMILAPGLLLLTPGFFTDAVGFALLVPGVRDSLMRYIAARVTVSQFTMGQPGGHPGGQPGARRPKDDVVDGDFHEIPQSTIPSEKAGPSGWTKH